MDVLNKVKDWATSLTEAGISLIALGVVLEVLFNGQNIPFWPNVNIISNIQDIVAGFSAQGLVGLVAVWVLYSIFTKK
tara:strand:+ start:1107 stop:1340 length:234 start_codon:yes stop_codon:yes gene_type:complete